MPSEWTGPADAEAGSDYLRDRADGTTGTFRVERIDTLESGGVVVTGRWVA